MASKILQESLLIKNKLLLIRGKLQVIRKYLESKNILEV